MAMLLALVYLVISCCCVLIAQKHSFALPSLGFQASHQAHIHFSRRLHAACVPTAGTQQDAGV
jgi:hypothetical protein